MAEYTYKDVIIDPDDPRVEIGKEYYFGCLPRDVLKKANTNSSLIGELKEIRKEDNFPFVFMDFTDGRSCIIRKKEPEKRYVPFDLSDKKVRDELRGKWIIPKGHSDSIETQITLFGSQMTEYGKIWCVDMDITPDKLLASWTFIDGTPCGKLVEQINDQTN